MFNGNLIWKIFSFLPQSKNSSDWFTELYCAQIKNQNPKNFCCLEIRSDKFVVEEKSSVGFWTKKPKKGKLFMEGCLVFASCCFSIYGKIGLMFGQKIFKCMIVAMYDFVRCRHLFAVILHRTNQFFVWIHCQYEREWVLNVATCQ